ncbi:MAG TPA: hypothetical protein VF909_01475 [Roseiflexaceae bacterium]
MFARDLDHLVRTLGWSTNTEDGITSGEDPLSNGMENLIERRITDMGRPRELHEGQGKPLPNDRNMTRAEERKRIGFHRVDIRCQLVRIIARTRSIGAGDQDHE